MNETLEKIYNKITGKIEEKPNLEDFNPQIYFSNNSQEIILKDAILDLSKVESTLSEKYLWRPKSFNQYIGQENAKNILEAYIKGSLQYKKVFPHVLIIGKAGQGKTTLAYIMAQMLQKNFSETVALTVKKPQDLIDKLADITGGVLYLDEIHTINSKIANFILPLLEDFCISGKNVLPFTLVASTTELGILLKKYKPLVDRFKIQINLEDYYIKELEQIIKQYHKINFKEVSITDQEINIIALNCRLTPRIALRLLESFIYMGNIQKVLNSYSLIYQGLNKADKKVLDLLVKYPEGLGIDTIAGYLETSANNYLYMIEGYLLKLELIQKTKKGRIITEEGKKMLLILKEKENEKI